MLGSARLGYGNVLLVVVEECSAVTVFPQTQRVRRVRLSCLGDRPRPFLPQANQGQAMETPSARAHKQTTATVVTCSRTPPGMDTDGLERVTDGLDELSFSPKKSHQRSQSTGCVLVRKAPTNPVRKQLNRSRQMGASDDTRDRVPMSSPLGQAVR